MVEARLHTLTYEDYLKTPDDERWELLNGELLMVPGPNTAHQRTIRILLSFLDAFVTERSLGEFFVSPYDVVLSPTNVLQPDLLFVARDRESIITADNIKGAPSIVIEVMSPSTSTRDREVKRDIYSEYGVGEYWLVDPYACTISVMALQGNAFQGLATYGVGDILASPALPGLSLDLRDIFQSL